MCLKWRSLSKPTVCAVQGYCIYHACAVASSCDLIIAADDAKFMPSLVEATFLPWDVHPRKAREIMMLQRFILAPEAEELGLVNRVVPREELMATALATAATLASYGPPRVPCSVLLLVTRLGSLADGAWKNG